jgi:hypothetical protein
LPPVRRGDFKIINYHIFAEAEDASTQLTSEEIASFNTPAGKPVSTSDGDTKSIINYHITAPKSGYPPLESSCFALRRNTKDSSTQVPSKETEAGERVAGKGKSGFESLFAATSGPSANGGDTVAGIGRGTSTKRNYERRARKVRDNKEGSTRDGESGKVMNQGGPTPKDVLTAVERRERREKRESDGKEKVEGEEGEKGESWLDEIFQMSDNTNFSHDYDISDSSWADCFEEKEEDGECEASAEWREFFSTLDDGLAKSIVSTAVMIHCASASVDLNLSWGMWVMGWRF